MTSILFLHANAEAYLADSLLHGLRSVLGAEVVDVPRRDSMYRVDDQSLTYGRGFTLYGTLREVPARACVGDRPGAARRVRRDRLRRHMALLGGVGADAIASLRAAP